MMTISAGHKELNRIREENLQLRSLLAEKDNYEQSLTTFQRELTEQAIILAVDRHGVDQQTRLFDTVLSSITDFTYIIDRDGRLTYANKALLNLWNLTLEEAVGKTFFDLNYPHELATRLHQQIQTVFDTGLMLRDETPYTGAAGTSGYYEYIFVPVLDAEGAVEIIAGSTRDISNRHSEQKERAALTKTLERERARLLTLFKQAPALMAVLRGPEHIFEFANPHYYQLAGHRDLIGKSIREAFPDIEGQGFFEVLDEVYRTGEPFFGTNQRVILQYDPVTPPQERYLDFAYQPLIEDDGSVSGILVHGVDRTARWQGEQAIRASSSRQALILRLMQGQRETNDPKKIMAAAAEEIGQHLGVNRVGFFELADDDTMAFDISWTDGALAPLSGLMSAHALGRRSLAEVREGRILCIDDTAQNALTIDSTFGQIGAKAIIVVPIMRGGRWCASFYVIHSEIRVWTNDEIAMVREVGEQTWDSVERAQAGIALRESENRFRELANNMAQSAWIADASGRMLWYNQRWLDYTGMNLDDLHIWGWTKVHHPDHVERVVESFADHIHTGEAWEDMFPLRGKDGSYRWFLAHVNPIRDEGGNVTRWFGTNMDMTAQLAAQEALRQSETSFRLLVEQSPSSIQVLDPDGHTLQVNRIWEQLWGLKLDDILDYNILQDQLLIENGSMPYIQRAFAGESVTIPPIFYDAKQTLAGRTTPGAIPRWIQAFMYPVTDEHGRMREIVVLHEDITEQRNAGIAQAHLEAIIRSSADAIISKDLDGIVMSWNPAAERIYGYAAEEIIGRSKAIMMPPDMPEELSTILRKISAGERIEHYETSRIHKSGTKLALSVSISPIHNANGEIVGASTIAHDNAERVEHLQQIETLNVRLKRAMIETHHRVKNNLQLVAALIELQRSTYGDIVPVANLLRLKQNIQALGIIHDILTKEAKSDGDAAFLPVKAVLEQFLPILQSTLPVHRINVQIEDFSLPAKQATALMIAANELISNAVKHGKGDIELMLRASDNRATLEVCDDGPGFAPDFDSRTAANTGLELLENIARYDLRGDIAYKNRIEGGARIVIVFPIDPASL